jgi:hypothetical protein
MIVAERDHRIIGFRALMRWRYRVGDRTIEAVRPVDTVTHPDERGRGVFSHLTRTALEALKGEVDLVFNTPNQNSLPGYLKMGWQVVGEVPVRIQITRPVRFAAGKLRRRRDADRPELPPAESPTAAEALEDEDAVARLLEEAEVPVSGYSTPRSVDYLRWRYGSAPLLGYHAVRSITTEICGYGLFRSAPKAAVVCRRDVIVRPGDVGSARNLLRSARRPPTCPRGGCSPRLTALRATGRRRSALRTA